MTAIEWVINYLNNVKPSEFCSIETIREILEQAKEMEKEQIVDAHYQGYRNFIDTTEISEQYYNETYGSKENDEYTEINWGGVIQKIPIETNGNNVEKVPNVTSSQTEISDEEIAEKAEEFELTNGVYGFKHGVKWYREQLKQRQ